MGCFLSPKAYQLWRQISIAIFLFLGVVRKNKWHHWIPEERLVQMPALPPVPIRRYRLHASIHGRHPLSPEAKLVMHCGSCCDALWVTADAAADARPGAPATRWYKRVSRSRIGASWHLEKRCSGSQLIGECDGDKIKGRILEDLEDRH